VRVTFLEIVVCGLEQSTWSLKAEGLSHLQLFIWSWVLSNIYPIYKRKAAHHSRKGKLLLLHCGHISWNCEKWRVVTGSRKIILLKRSHALSSLTPQTLYIRMSPRMCSEMNPFIRSWSNDRRRFITDVGIFALAVAFPFSFWLPFDLIAVSWKWMYIRGISSMIQLHLAKASPEGTYKVV